MFAVAATGALAAQDPLTGAANRATLTRALRQELATAQGPTALLFGDLDGFRAVDDRLVAAADEAVYRVERSAPASLLPGVTA